MKQLSLFASMVFALAASAHAQLEGFGWDNKNQEIDVRIGLGGYSHVEGGLGLQWDNGAPDNNSAQRDAAMNVTASGRFLLALHQWDKLTGFLNLGVHFQDDSFNEAPASRRSALFAFAGYQPELKLLDHLAISVAFGANMKLMKDFGLDLTGDPISIVEGINFRILL